MELLRTVVLAVTVPGMMVCMTVSYAPTRHSKYWTAAGLTMLAVLVGFLIPQTNLNLLAMLRAIRT